MKKGVIYTCITGEYDNLRDYLVIDKAWDYICFSDTAKTSIYNKSWKIVPLSFNMQDDVRNARWHKINPHKTLSEYKYSVWVDANVDIVDKEFYSEIDKHIKNNELFAVMKHPDRDCIYDEADVIIDWKIDNPNIVTEQITKMREHDYPKHNGLIVSSILFREHNDKSVSAVMDDWWGWVCDYSKRDQLSLNYVLWELNFKPTRLPFKYKGGQSGSLFWRRHDNGLKAVRQKELYIVEQSELIASQNQQINRLKQLIASQNQQINDLREQVSALYSSLSWKITNPLRIVNGAVHKIINRNEK